MARLVFVSRHAKILAVAGWVGALALTVVAAFVLGSVCISPEKWFSADDLTRALLELRARRIMAAFCVGGALAVAGAAYQAVLRNPLAEPYIMGVSAGAGLGAAWAVGPGGAAAWGLPGAAFAGALLSLGLVLLIAGRGLDPLRLLLAGVIVGTVFSGILMFAVSCLTAAENQGLLWWMLGSLQTPEPRLLIIVAVVVPLGTLYLWRFGDAADIITLGAEMAHGMGVDRRRAALALLVTATLLTALAVALAGIIGFVGLLVPHCLRLAGGARYRRLFVTALFGGGIFLINCDTLSRCVFSTREIPVGVVTALIGGPLFIAMLLRKKTIT